MDHTRLQELAATLLAEAKSLLDSSDRSAVALTDPILDSGKPMAQTFRASRAGDSDYEIWIRLLRLHSSARNVIDHGEEAAVGLKQQINELERLLLPPASPEEGSERGPASVTIRTD